MKRFLIKHLMQTIRYLFLKKKNPTIFNRHIPPLEVPNLVSKKERKKKNKLIISAELNSFVNQSDFDL